MIWKESPSLPGYFASDAGLIKGPLGVRRTRVDRYGYERLNAHKDGKVRTFQVAHLVAEAFHGERQPDTVVRHLDGDQRNNKPANLAYGTVEQNLADQVRHGTFPNKIEPADAIAIRARARAGERVMKLAGEYGLHCQQIYRIKNGQRWRSAA